MDLRQLDMLRAIAETGSFTGAGEKLHVSQSAISRQIKLLEEELNEPLFSRSGRRVVITPAGETLLQLSHRVFADVNETKRLIGERQRVLSGTLRLAAGMTVCLYVYPLIIKEFRRHHPKVDIKLVTGPTPRLLRRLKAGAIDLALLTLPIEEPDLETVPVLHEELLLIMPRDHPLAGRKRIGPQDLVHQPFVVYEGGSNTRRMLDQFFTSAQIDPRIVLETENVEILKALVRIGLGLSLVPYLAIAREVRAGQLACSRISGVSLERETGWVYPRTGRVPRILSEVIRTLEQLKPRLRLSPDEP